jgi:hypothetical protein
MKKLTVAEYAELQNISVQAVYKKIERLKTVEEERNGRTITLIIIEEEQEKAAGGDIKPAEVEFQPSIQPISTDNQPQIQPQKVEIQPDNQPQKVEFQPKESGDIQPQLNPLQGQDPAALLIATLQEQIKEKDKQIERLQKAAEEKDRQIKEQFERLTQLINQEQQLGAATHKVLLGQGEAEQEEDTPPQEEQQEKPAPRVEIEEKQKKGFLRRLLGL